MLRFFVLITLFITLSLNASVVILENEKLPKNFTVSYLKDDTSTLSLESISAELFTKNSSNSFSLGYNKGDVWIKLDVINTTNKERFIISINETFYEKANLYYYDKGWKVQKNGLFLPLEKRVVKYNKLSFDVAMPKGIKQTFYLQLHAKYAYFGKVSIQEKELFYFNNALGIDSAYFFSLGTIFLVFIFNILLYLSIKEKIFLYYMGYSFFNFLYILNISGLLVYFGLQDFIYDLQLSAAFMLGFLILFSLEYLETKKYLPRLHIFLYYSSFAFFFVGVCVAYSYEPWNKVINNFAGLYNVLLILSSLIIYSRENRKIGYYIFAIGTYFFFVVLFTSMVLGVIEYNALTRYGFIFASVLESILFALLLVDRYTQKEKRYQLELKNEITIATQDLQYSNTKLQKLIQERELLLKEVFHRVKNNFHLISSILWFEMRNKPEQKETFSEIINRIHSMSMIHEHLYNSENVNDIDLKEYLHKIIYNIQQSHEKADIRLMFNADSITLEFDDTVSLGIILNEVITNSLKHNKSNQRLKIEVTLQRNADTIELNIQDNGTGFDSTNKTKGLGLKLVEQFCKKLQDADFSFVNEDGLKFVLLFTLR